METDARDAIKRYIYKRCIYQAGLARKAGLTPLQLSNILNKRRKLDANEFMALCNALDATPDEIMQDK